MKNILITGSEGFIGSHLTELCVKNGYNVKAFVHYNSNGSVGWLEHSELKSEMEIISGDVRDYDIVRDAVNGCDTVFHLAALIGIPYSYRSPQAYIRTNIDGTYNVLEAARQQGSTEVLITSTSETYGTAQYVPIDEKHPLKGQSPYSASKIGADQLAYSYFCSFGLPLKIVRPFNTYGPRQSSRAIIPTIITQILNGNDSIKLGYLTSTRDFTFVEDTVKGFVEIAQTKDLSGEVVNIGMNKEISIGDLVNLISDLMGKKINIVEDIERLRPKASEVERLCCNNEKIFKFTQWKPEIDLEQGIFKTVQWVKENIRLFDTEKYHV